MNNLNLGMALVGVALLAPFAKASGVCGSADPVEGAKAFPPAEAEFPLYLADLPRDVDAYVESVIAEITASIARRTETADPQAGGPATIYADTPFHADEYWGSADYEIPGVHWESVVYEIPLDFELSNRAGTAYDPAGFGPGPMTVDLARWNDYVSADPVLMLEVRVHF